MDFSTGSEVPSDDTATAVRTSKTVDTRAFEVKTDAKRDELLTEFGKGPLPAPGRDQPGFVRARRGRLRG